MLRAFFCLTSALFLASCTGDAEMLRLAPEGAGKFVPGCGAGCDAPGVSPRLARLTHTQWENTVQALLKLPQPSGLSSTFTSDAQAGSFDTVSQNLVVGSSLWNDYQRAAEVLAGTATESDANLARWIRAGLPTEAQAKADAFIRDLLRRAYRRPPEEDEVARYKALFAKGVELTGISDPFRAGARVTLQAVLQSPHFLYRVERSQTVGAEGVIALTGFEKASRLSFALWNSSPDESLLADAESGALETDEGVLQQATRMLEDPRAKQMLSRFHAQLLELELFRQVVRDPTKFPGISSSLAASLEEEARLFVEDVVSTRKEGLSQLLTRNTTFVNAELAGLYGLQGSFDASFKPAQLDGTQRSGLLTRLGFMTYYGHNADSDPIRRGVFVNLRLLCADLPPPPNNIPPLPAANGGTMREVVTHHTGAGTCGAGCHGVFINPIGFAFENYDGVGRWRTTDNSKPVDASAQYLLKNGTMLEYQNAVELSQKLAQTQQTHDCYLRNWTSYLLARQPAVTDENLISRLGEASLQGASSQQLVLSIVTSKTFLNRLVEEIQ